MPRQIFIGQYFTINAFVCACVCGVFARSRGLHIFIKLYISPFFLSSFFFLNIIKMTEVVINNNNTEEKVVQEQEYQDRFLEGSQRLVPYDLLEARGKLDQCTDPDAKNYKNAKELFRKGYELCMTIPRSLDDDILEKHEEDIKTASETMVEAWLLDERAAPMSERILILGQQYEKVLLKNIPEEEKEGFFVKDSLLFSAWILLVGRQFKHW